MTESRLEKLLRLRQPPGAVIKGRRGVSRESRIPVNGINSMGRTAAEVERDAESVIQSKKKIGRQGNRDRSKKGNFRYAGSMPFMEYCAREKERRGEFREDPVKALKRAGRHIDQD